jgi:hypothetical protein
MTTRRLILTGTLSFQEWDRIRSIKFSERADSTVVAEVLDGFYYDTAQCGECGTPSDGCNAIYLLTAASGGSPGLSSQLVYSLDKGKTWATIDISTLGGLAGNRAWRRWEPISLLCHRRRERITIAPLLAAFRRQVG